MDPNIIWDAWVGILTLLCAAVIFVGLIVNAVGRIVCWFLNAPTRRLQSDEFQALLARNEKRDQTVRDQRTFAQVQESWPSILDAVRQQSVVAAAVYRDATPTRLDRGVLVIEMPRFPQATRALHEFDELLRRAACSVLDIDVLIDFDLRGKPHEEGERSLALAQAAVVDYELSVMPPWERERALAAIAHRRKSIEDLIAARRAMDPLDRY